MRDTVTKGFIFWELKDNCTEEVRELLSILLFCYRIVSNLFKQTYAESNRKGSNKGRIFRNLNSFALSSGWCKPSKKREAKKKKKLQCERPEGAVIYRLNWRFQNDLFSSQFRPRRFSPPQDVLVVIRKCVRIHKCAWYYLQYKGKLRNLQTRCPFR